MITLDLSILNQKGTPMFNSDTLANRPAAGIVGRIFIAIDAPYGIYRDTGSAWDQISGASTFSGSLATGQVAFGSATNTISGTNNLFWDNANGRLGIGTNVPTNDLSINKSVDGVVRMNITNLSTGVNAFSGLAVFNSAGVAAFQLTGTGNTLVLPNQARLTTSSNVTNGLYILTQANAPLLFGTNDQVGMTMFGSTRNVVIQNSGTFIDGGQRLQVYGDAFVKGSGATSATNALLVQNSAGSSVFNVNNAGWISLGSAATNPLIYSFTTAGFSNDITGTNIGFYVRTSTQSASNGRIWFGGATLSQTTGNVYNIYSASSFNPTSGNANYFDIGIAPTINQIGGANGITRGIYVSPILTAAADWRSIEWSNNSGWGLYGAGTANNYLGGTLGIKTTSPYAPSTFSLDVNGGLLVKNTAGTTAQITLINADPSVGGNEGFLVTSVGGTSTNSFVQLQGYYGLSLTGSTALRLNPLGGNVIINSSTDTGEQFQLTGSIRVNGQTSATSGGVSGQHLIINCDGVQYKIELRNP